MDTEEKIRHLFDLFAKFGHENYIGEEVSQLQHAQVMPNYLGSVYIFVFLTPKHKKNMFSKQE